MELSRDQRSVAPSPFRVSQVRVLPPASCRAALKPRSGAYDGPFGEHSGIPAMFPSLQIGWPPVKSTKLNEVL